MSDLWSSCLQYGIVSNEGLCKGPCTNQSAHEPRVHIHLVLPPPRTEPWIPRSCICTPSRPSCEVLVLASLDLYLEGCSHFVDCLELQLRSPSSGVSPLSRCLLGAGGWLSGFYSSWCCLERLSSFLTSPRRAERGPNQVSACLWTGCLWPGCLGGFVAVGRQGALV